jgi:arylsulfatase A-like enzyme
MIGPAVIRMRERRRLVARTLHRPIPASGQPILRTDDRRFMLAAAGTFGLCAGWLETGVAALQSWLDPRIDAGILRTNVHSCWMAPAANLLLFGLLGACLIPLARRRERGWRIAAFLLASLAFLAGLRAVRGLHSLASLLLAMGLGRTVARRIDLCSSRWRSRLLKVFPVLVGVLVALAIVQSRWVAEREEAQAATLPAPPSNAPNVVLLVMDTVRAQSVSLGRPGRDTTPRLRRLAERGVCFEEARATAPWTLPSHASMFTGHWPHELTIGVDRALDGRARTLAEVLRDRGYLTAGFVANVFYCNARYGIDRGFLHYDDIAENRSITPGELLRSVNLARPLVDAITGEQPPLPEHYTFKKDAREVNRAALAWIDRHAGAGRPFFAFLNYMDAHAPYELPDGAKRRFSSPDRRVATLESMQRSLYRRIKRAEREGNEAQLADLEQQADAVKSELLALRLDVYEDCIAFIDEQIDTLLNELDRRGLLRDALIIITSDHGEHFGEHGLAQHGHSLYRPLIHVPLVIVGPENSDVPRGRVVQGPASLRDLPATIVDLLGLPGESAPFPGKSLRRFWDSHSRADATASDVVLAEVEQQTKVKPTPLWPASYGAIRAAVDSESTYIRHEAGREELYSLTGDPAETHNLAGEAFAAPELLRMRRELDRTLAGPAPAR